MQSTQPPVQQTWGDFPCGKVTGLKGESRSATSGAISLLPYTPLWRVQRQLWHYFSFTTSPTSEFIALRFRYPTIRGHITVSDRVVRHAVKRAVASLNFTNIALTSAAIPPRLWTVRWVDLINVIVEPTESYKRYLSDKERKDSIQIRNTKANFTKGNIFTSNQRFHTDERPLLPFVHQYILLFICCQVICNVYLTLPSKGSAFLSSNLTHPNAIQLCQSILSSCVSQSLVAW